MISLNDDAIVTAANFIDNNGLLAGYGFIVKGVQEINKVKFVKVKNPWRDSETK